MATVEVFGSSRSAIVPHPSERRSLIAIGIFVTLMGALASLDLALATIAATAAVGAMMIVAATLQLVHVFAIARWSGKALWTLSGLLYLVAGICVLVDPLFAAVMLTLFLAISMAISGILRFALMLRWNAAGRGWLLISSVVSVAAAAIILLGWPANSLWVLGLVLAVDLMLQGSAFALVGFSLRGR